MQTITIKVYDYYKHLLPYNHYPLLISTLLLVKCITLWQFNHVTGSTSAEPQQCTVLSSAGNHRCDPMAAVGSRDWRFVDVFKIPYDDDDDDDDDDHDDDDDDDVWCFWWCLLSFFGTATLRPLRFTYFEWRTFCSILCSSWPNVGNHCKEKLYHIVKGKDKHKKSKTSLLNHLKRSTTGFCHVNTWARRSPGHLASCGNLIICGNLLRRKSSNYGRSMGAPQLDADIVDEKDIKWLYKWYMH